MSGALRIGVVLMTAAIAIQTSATAASRDAGPSWLRAPAVRGPIAASFTLDGRDVRWGFDGAIQTSVFIRVNGTGSCLRQ